MRPEFYLLSSGKFAARKKSIQFYCKGGHAQRKNVLIEHATRFQIYLIFFFVIKSRYFCGDKDIWIVHNPKLQITLGFQSVLANEFASPHDILKYELLPSGEIAAKRKKAISFWRFSAMEGLIQYYFNHCHWHSHRQKGQNKWKMRWKWQCYY